MIVPNKNYTIPELAKESGWSENTIRTMFRHHPLVLKKSGPSTRRVSVRIPGTVALQVFGDLQREPTVVKLVKIKKEKRKIWLNPAKHKKAVARAEEQTTATIATAA